MFINFLRSIALVWRAFPKNSLLATVKYLARSALHPWTSWRWHAEIGANPLLLQAARQQPRIFMKPLRPYLNKTFAPRARVAALASHYEFVARRLGPSFLAAAAHGRGIAVATLSASEGRRYSAHLASTDTFDREGEFVLSLQCDAARQRVACVTFSIVNIGDAPRLHIGCLQGPPRASGKALVKQATRDFHGMRPKNVLIDALYTLAGSWSIQRIVAVGNQQRIMGGGCDQVRADYDSFWQELGGKELPGEHYQLPAALHHRSLDEVPSQRRSEYRRRQALRQTLAAQIFESLALASADVVRAPIADWERFDVPAWQPALVS